MAKKESKAATVKKKVAAKAAPAKKASPKSAVKAKPVAVAKKKQTPPERAVAQSAKPASQKSAPPKPAPPKTTSRKSAPPKPASRKSVPPKAAPTKPAVPKPVAQKSAPPKPAPPPPTPPKPVTPEGDASSRKQGGGVSLKFLLSVAQAIKDAVAPLAQQVKGRDIVAEAVSGDVTFQIDRVAERALQVALKSAGLPISYYSEDEGYSTFSSKQPKHLLIVDPIDGTRAAKSGFEACVVAVASTRVLERPTVADIDCACVMEILGNRVFLAERGKGARIYVDGRLKRPKLSDNTDLEAMTWSMTIPARPAELIFPTAARIIDLSSLKGGFFACNSTSYSLTRLLSNQLDACVDVANRYYRDIPERVQDYFLNAGRGKIIGIAPYDMAAALLIAEEAGCIVTDAYGNRFDNLLLLDSSPGNHQSIIAASNRTLHEKLLSFFDTRIKQYETLLKRHHH